MATEIVRSLEEIDGKVKNLNKTLKASADETKELDKALKLDPKSTETVDKKMKTLQASVGTAAQKVALLKQKQDEAAKAFQKGDISAAEYKKIELAVIKAENEVKALNAEITKTAKIKVDQTAAGFDKLTGNLKKAEGVAKSFSKVAMGLVAGLAAAATAFIVLGDEIHDTSTKFRISAEQLQYQRNLYAKTTDDAKNYGEALTYPYIYPYFYGGSNNVAVVIDNRGNLPTHCVVKIEAETDTPLFRIIVGGEIVEQARYNVYIRAGSHLIINSDPANQEANLYTGASVEPVYYLGEKDYAYSNFVTIPSGESMFLFTARNSQFGKITLSYSIMREVI